MSDFEFLSLEFEFEGSKYPALIRRKAKESANEYYVTIMQGELEKILFGNHIIRETNGHLEAAHTIHDLRQATLQCSIIHALNMYLQSKQDGPLSAWA